MNNNVILFPLVVIVALCAWLIFRGLKKRKQDPVEPSPRKGGGTGGDEPGPP